MNEALAIRDLALVDPHDRPMGTSGRDAINRGPGVPRAGRELKNRLRKLRKAQF
jgi:hypothetical protein